MATNLESLLHLSLAGDTSLVSSNFNVFQISKSLFENEIGAGFDGIIADSASLDASYFTETYREGNGEECKKIVYDHPTADFYNKDSWMTTPISLPCTPDSTTPNSPSVLTLHPATPTLMKLPPCQQATPLLSQPLTPDSSSNSDDSKRDRDLMDIISFLQEPGPSMSTGYDHFYSFHLPLTYDQASAVSSADDGSSIYSASPSLLTQHSPLSSDLSSSYSPNPSPLNSSNFSPLHSPLCPNLSPHPQVSMPSDTIRNLLTQSSPSDETSTNIPIPSRFVKPDIPNTGSNPLKRKSDLSFDSSGSKKHALSGSRSKKPVIAGTRKERKREQNKTAALRYRQKKKEEKDEVDDQQGLLEEKNALLKNTLSSLEAEVDYLKKLWDKMTTHRHNVPGC